MNYTVLARKYRPQSFEEMTGQAHVIRTFENAISLGRVAHAYLLSGPRGVGKTTAARLLSRALNCEKGPTAKPCRTCRACVEIRDGTSTDVIEIDGASNNGVDNVRDLRESAKYLPQHDRFKIYIIDEVHMLSQAAFNALLKTLEEPPPHVKFIFATTEPRKLPETIVSRCQRHNFRRIGAQAIVARLKDICAAEGFTLGENALAMIASASEGGMRDALSLLDQVIASRGVQPSDADVADALGRIDTRAIAALAGALVRLDGKAVLAQIDAQWAEGTDLQNLAEALALTLRHACVVAATGVAPPELADADAAAVMEIARDADLALLARAFDVVHGAIWEVARSSQPKIAFEMACLKAVFLAPAGDIPSLISRLEAIEGSTGAPGGRPESPSFRQKRA